MAENPTLEPWMRRSGYKYGMLAFLALMAVWQTRILLRRDQPMGAAALMGFIPLGMLLVNHVAQTFLDPSQQRRFAPLQIAILLGALAFMALMYWREFGGG